MEVDFADTVEETEEVLKALEADLWTDVMETSEHWHQLAYSTSTPLIRRISELTVEKM